LHFFEPFEIAAEMLHVAQVFIERNLHPTIIVSAYRKALDEAVKALETIAYPIDVTDYDQLLKVAMSTTGTKFISRYGPTLCGLAVKAVQKVIVDRDDGKKDVDIKQYIRIEKIPGGEIADSVVLEGIMLNKDVTHPQMARRIENPRVVLLDCPLEYKKGESQTNIELSSGEDWTALLKMEEEYIERICKDIIAVKPDLVITEKGVSDLAQHHLMKAGIAAIRRVRKTDNNRIARAVGAKIANRTETLSPEDVGTECGLFEVQKIGDEYFTYLVKCKNPKACTVVLRGGSKDVLNEIERNLDDAMGVCRTLINDPRVVPGGGACEMAVSRILTERSRFIEGVEQWPFKAVANALEVIPRTLMENCGAQTIRVLTELRAKHAENGNTSWGVDGNTGELRDIRTIDVIEPLAVKAQTLKTAIESATLLLRVDEIVSGIGKKGGR
jgi:T-complex protein 1 subunit gamma